MIQYCKTKEATRTPVLVCPYRSTPACSSHTRGKSQLCCLNPPFHLMTPNAAVERAVATIPPAWNKVFVKKYDGVRLAEVNSKYHNHIKMIHTVTLRLVVYRKSVRLGTKPLEDHDQYFFFQLNTCSYSAYVTSLTRGWVCRIQLLQAFAIAVTFGPESLGTHGHILLSQIRDSPNLEGQVPIFISPRNRVAQLYPQALCCLFVTSCD
jgi:hypothetical protein